MRISTSLIAWYELNKRDLPWRKTNDPYAIWLSEVMLQQTRVKQGLPYYLKFLDKYPTVHHLASATEQEVLTLWQGLGYYSRARNMHATAIKISTDYNGIFPNSYKEILALKGVGEYTAAAISSFAFDLPHPVIDGNVYRVISRLFAIEEPINKPSGQKVIKAAVNEIFDTKNPAIWNQAIMEFGSLQCTPKNPNCSTCVLAQNCLSLAQEKVDKLPYKEGKTKVKSITHSYIHFCFEGKTYIEKRVEGIWKNMYQFPLLEKELNASELLQKSDTFGIEMKNHKLLEVFSCTHLLSHRKISAFFYTITLDSKPLFSKSDIFEIDLEELGNKYPASILIHKYLNHIQGDD